LSEVFAMTQSWLHWILVSGSLVALVVTIGVAILLVCCLSCARCPLKEKDELFKRREV
jgi:hypothetical protein